MKYSRSNRFALLSLVASSFAMSVGAYAADKTWLGTTTDWDTATSSNWVGPTTWATDDNAIFNATGAGAVNIAVGGVSAQNLTFNNNSYTIQGNGLTLTGTRTINTATGISATITAVISGTDGLTKTGDGTLILNSATANLYTGGTTISAGTLTLGTTNASLGSNTAANTLTFSGGTFDDNHVARSYAHNLVFTASTSSTIKTSGVGAANSLFTGSATGSGNVTFGSTTGNTRINGDWSGYTGTVTVSASGGFYFNSAASASASASYVLTNAAYLNAAGTFNFGSLSGTAGINTNAAGRTVSVGALNTDTSYSGAISNAGGLAKVGSGTFTLSSASTYSGGTTINAGKLLANNTTNSATGTGSVTVKDTATFGGTGAVSGAVILESGGTLAPGTSIESLATGALTIPAGATLAAEINSSTLTSDSVAVTDNLTLGGNLTVTDLAPAVITLGTKLTLLTYTGTLDVTFSAFSGKPEGSTFAVGSNTFKIRYADGGGNVTLEAVAGGADYSDWASTNAPAQSSALDHDNDGVSNGVEYVLGGLAANNDLDKLPIVSTTTSPGNLTFSFTRKQSSKTADTTVTIDVGTTLSTWASHAVPNSGTLGFVTVTDIGGGNEEVKLTVTQTPDTKKFARLNVVITP